MDKPCKDCCQEDPAQLRKQRPAPHPGPRCVTHHRAVTKARKVANHARTVQKTYGLEPGEYEQLLAYQGGFCALCRRANGRTRRLSVDHDHATGDVRGLLCRPCNTILGHARDAIAFFDRASFYLKHTPYARMKGGWPRLGMDKEGPNAT